MNRIACGLLALLLAGPGYAQCSRNLDTPTCLYSTFTAKTGSTLDLSAGTVTLPADAIGASQISNVTRTVNIPLRSFIECTTDAGADINFSSGADAFPDFINSATDGTGFTLTYDDTGASEDTAHACAQFVVPDTYASGGSFVFRVTKDAHTAGNTELLTVQISNDGAALEAAGTTAVTAAAVAEYTVTPTIAGLSAGESVSFTLRITSGGTMDDTVNIHSVGFEYTATQ